MPRAELIVMLGELLTAGIAEKKARSIRCQMGISKLPLVKELADFEFTDVGENHVLEVENAVLHHRQAPPSEDADVTVKLSRRTWDAILTRETSLAARPTAGVPVLLMLEIQRVVEGRSIPLETNRLSTFVGEPVSYAFRLGQESESASVRVQLTPLALYGDVAQVEMEIGQMEADDQKDPREPGGHRRAARQRDPVDPERLLLALPLRSPPIGAL